MGSDLQTGIVSPTDRLDGPEKKPALIAQLRDLHPGLAFPRHGEPIGGVAKRTADIAFAFAGLVLFAPLMAVIAALVAFQQQGSVLQRRPRPGFLGRPFDVLTFRTGPDEPTTGDTTPETNPRGLAALLSRTGLAGLPRLFNVLRGDMGIVGPRVKRFEAPMPASAGFPRSAILGLARPGMTGPVQTSPPAAFADVRSAEHACVRLEIDYLDHWSLWLDAKILARALLGRPFRRRAQQ